MSGGPSGKQNTAPDAGDEVAIYLQHAREVAGKFAQTSSKRSGKKPVNPLGVKDASPIGKTHKRTNSLNSQQVAQSPAKHCNATQCSHLVSCGQVRLRG